MGKKLKKIKKTKHATYNKKAFLAPDSILSMAAIHAKIKDDGEAILRISDCNTSVRIWNNFNIEEQKTEMLQKIGTLISSLQDFETEIKIRSAKITHFSVKTIEPTQ